MSLRALTGGLSPALHLPIRLAQATRVVEACTHAVEDDTGGGSRMAESVPTPALVPDGGAFSSVSTGNVHTCGVRQSDGQVLCW